MLLLAVFGMEVRACLQEVGTEDGRGLPRPAPHGSVSLSRGFLVQYSMCKHGVSIEMSRSVCTQKCVYKGSHL